MKILLRKHKLIMTLIIYVFLATAPALANYDEFGSKSIGHNLSSNNNTLYDREWSIGTLYAGYGVTDDLTIGTSLFVLTEYEMFNLMTRYAWDVSFTERLGIDLAYFKTFGGEVYYDEFEQRTYYTDFIMEAVNAKFTYSNQFNNFYRFNTTLSYFYYFDERLPFSFRMDPANNDPFTINLTSLHEFKLNQNLFINLEAGLWGLNYKYLYYHTGASINLQNEILLLGAGVSTTFSPTFPSEEAREFVRYDSRYSIHPEIQMQVFF